MVSVEEMMRTVFLSALTVQAIHYQGGSYRVDLAGPGTFALSIDTEEAANLEEGSILSASVIPERAIVFPH